MALGLCRVAGLPRFDAASAVCGRFALAMPPPAPATHYAHVYNTTCIAPKPNLSTVPHYGSMARMLEKQHKYFTGTETVQTRASTTLNSKARVFFFFVVVPFCSCPASLVSRIFFAVGPGCAKCFFFCCAPLGSATFRRGQSKKKTPPRVFFFFAPAPGKGKGRRSPVGRRHGARAKKRNTTQGVFFFCCGPGEKAREGEAPLGAGTGPEPKKKTPCVVLFFLLWPRAGAQRGFSFACLFAGAAAKKKKTPWVVFFFLLWPRAGAQRGFSFPCLSPGPQQKKKNALGGVFFLLRPRADAHSLTAGLGGDASPSPGWCFFFAAAPPGPGWCFFFLLWPRPDAHSLTVGWGDFGKARVVFFFCCGPAGSF